MRRELRTERLTEGRRAAGKFATLFLTPSGERKGREGGKGEANDPELIDFLRRRFGALLRAIEKGNQDLVIGQLLNQQTADG